MKQVQKVAVKYSPGLDALYIWFLPRRKAKLVPVDEGLFFEYRSLTKSREVCGYELLDLAQFITADGTVALPITEPRVRYVVEGVSSGEMSLSHLIAWAHHRFCARGARKESVNAHASAVA